MGHKGHYGQYTGNAKWSKNHADTRVTKSNYKASERDDAAHIDYLKRDIDYDNKHGHSDENMTADEKHISKLAGDMKYDKKHHGSPAHRSGDYNDHDMGAKYWKAHKQTMHGIKVHGGPNMNSPVKKEGGKSKHGYLGTTSRWKNHAESQQHHTDPDAPRSEQDPTNPKNRVGVRGVKKKGTPNRMMGDRKAHKMSNSEYEAHLQSPRGKQEHGSPAQGKKGLWANIHAKRKRGESPAKPGDKDYPTEKALKDSQ